MGISGDISCLVAAVLNCFKPLFFSYDVHMGESHLVGPIAQSVEQRTFNPWVDGSSPSGPTFMPSLLRLRHAQNPQSPLYPCPSHRLET